jgi:L-seryl-tRNA(Ser) seleniumtransferase
VGQDKSEWFRKIPSVDRLLSRPSILEAASKYPRNLLLKATHDVLDQIRKQIKTGDILEHVSQEVLSTVERFNRPSLRPVINATGIVVHTNLGRSVLAKRVLEKFRSIAGGYSNLEYDLAKGERGSRYIHVESILREISAAEAAIVVNNNAAAVLAVLDTLAKGREVVVSRGQLVEIGGSFRIPEVMRKSGAKMVEVGTTNKTHLRDYEASIGPETALFLKVHKSNYHVIGFTEDVDTVELVNIGRKYGIPVVEDLGSGCFVDFSKFGLVKEPTVQEVLAEWISSPSVEINCSAGRRQASSWGKSTLWKPSAQTNSQGLLESTN